MRDPEGRGAFTQPLGFLRNFNGKLFFPAIATSDRNPRREARDGGHVHSAWHCPSHRGRSSSRSSSPFTGNKLSLHPTPTLQFQRWNDAAPVHCASGRSVAVTSTWHQAQVRSGHFESSISGLPRPSSRVAARGAPDRRVPGWTPDSMSLRRAAACMLLGPNSGR
jgi:hypothetical protein